MTYPRTPRCSNISVCGLLDLGIHNRYEDDVNKEDNSCNNCGKECRREGQPGTAMWACDAGRSPAESKEREYERKERQPACWNAF